MPSVSLPPVISDPLRLRFGAFEATPVAGGDINEAYRLDTRDGQRRFLKINRGPHAAGLFAQEVWGLRELAAFGARVPEILLELPGDEVSGLLLRYYEPVPRSARNDEDAGRQLGHLHRESERVHQGQRFERRGGFIGRLVLPDFAATEAGRYLTEGLLEPVLDACGDTLPARLVQRVHELGARAAQQLAGRTPCLVHGDLWSGNCLGLPGGRALLIDPAAHYGLPELDVAATQVFGGYHAGFGSAYAKTYPRPLEPRAVVSCIAYFLMAHVAMFGASYVRPLERLLSAQQG